MKKIISRFALLPLIISCLATASQSQTFKYAFQGSLSQLDPYSLNETFTISALGNVYEGLVRRNAKMEIEPALAESWQMLSPTHWRFHLRKGVKFHNGNDFTAEDVVFSARRVRSEGSNMSTYVGKDVKVDAIDDYTVDFILPVPNPVLTAEWEAWYMMDKEWAETNNAVAITSASDKSVNFAALHTNGTGPFKITNHQPGVKTIFEKNSGWWDKPVHNLEKAEFTPISSDATRVAALLSGELDMIFPVPVQDIRRIEQNQGTHSLTGPELRTVFLGMDQMRDELLHSSVKGKNPFKDVRVRKAFYQAIDSEGIKRKIMRNMSTPSALMISPLLFSKSDQFSRLPYDPSSAKQLLNEAGYGDGFSIQLDCPNDRYVNDEAICQAVASMLARVGIKVDLNTQPKAKFFAKVLAAGGYDTSFYLLGWTPASLDSWSVLSKLLICRDEKGNGGAFNLGGYCNLQVDSLTNQILIENDPVTRTQLIEKAFSLTIEDVAYIPLHQQALAWGVSDKVTLAQRADNQFLLRFVTKN